MQPYSASKKPDTELLEYAKSRGIPVLTKELVAGNPKAYAEFYKTLLETD